MSFLLGLLVGLPIGGLVGVIALTMGGHRAAPIGESAPAPTRGAKKKMIKKLIDF